MKPLSKYLQHGTALAGTVARDPRQVRDIPRWARTLSQTTLGAEIPWLPFVVIDRLEEHLTSTSKVFEFGGGGSTVWFANHAGEVVTVEHDPEWFPVLESAVAGRPGCTLIHETSENDYAGYVAAIDAYPDDTFDAVVVDGRERVRCLERALTKVKPGGLLVLDDANRTRYASAYSLAGAWPGRTYRGLTPTKNLPGVTAVWQRPLHSA